MIYSLLPFLETRQPDDPNGFAAPGMGGRPNQGQIATALASNPATAGISPDMVTGVGPAQGMPGGNPLLGAAIGRMGLGAMDRGDGGSDAMARPERYVRGAPQPMPAKVGNPQTDFQMAGMQNPVSSVGQFLLSPAGQQIIRALQGMGGAG